MSFIGRIATGASQERLESLIEERLKPGADKSRIDARIWDLFGEEWAVMFTDLSGFSRRVAEFGIIHFLQTIHEAQRILVPVIEAHDGILLKTEGDSLLVIFRSAARALQCALAMQRAVRDNRHARGGHGQGLGRAGHRRGAAGRGAGSRRRAGSGAGRLPGAPRGAPRRRGRLPGALRAVARLSLGGAPGTPAGSAPRPA